MPSPPSRRDLLKSAAAFALLPNLAAAADPGAPTLQTTYGPVTGYRASERVAAWKGIPYGADTRLTRFRAPRPPAPWTTPRLCTGWPTRAPQQSPTRAASEAPDSSSPHYHLPPDQGRQSEDCLYLNVWAPWPAKASRPLPILVYIHGGAYNNGTVNAALYDGTRLAEHGAVVVTVNHRLNAFGYLELAGLPGLAERYRDSGNAGQLDLVLALQWVRDNAAELHGDGDRVTIFGQSGGGAKCATLMAMPSAHGLFQRVLTMSGQQVWGVPMPLATHNARAALAAMGLDPAGSITPAQLDALTTEQIQLGARTTNNWLPVVDGQVLPRDPFEPTAPALSDAVPMILGNTRDEVAAAQAFRLAGLTWAELPGELARQIDPFRGPYPVDAIVRFFRRRYPAYTPVDVYVAAVALFRSWPGQVIEAEQRARNRAAGRHTWVYQMDFGSATADGRAPHTLDIAFMFDNLRLSPGMVGATPEDLAAAQPLATAMSTMLIHFGATGDPNGDPNGTALPHWPVYDLRTRDTMLFDRQSLVVSDPRGDERRMMEHAGYRQPGTA